MGPIRSGFRAVPLDSLGRLRRSHTDPGLEAAGSPAFGVGDGEDPASITHQRKRLPNADEERLRLRIKASQSAIYASWRSWSPLSRHNAFAAHGTGRCRLIAVTGRGR